MAMSGNIASDATIGNTKSVAEMEEAMPHEVAKIILNVEAAVSGKQAVYGVGSKSARRHRKKAAEILATFAPTIGPPRNVHYQRLEMQQKEALFAFLSWAGFIVHPTDSAAPQQSPSPPQATEADHVPQGSTDEPMSPGQLPSSPGQLHSSSTAETRPLTSPASPVPAQIREESPIPDEERQRLAASLTNFVDVVREMAIETGASYAQTNEWLRVLHKYKAMPNYDTLPKDCRAFMKPNRAYARRCVIKPMACSGKKSRTEGQPNVERPLMGQYVYFGLRDALIGSSPGQYLRDQYRKMLQRIHTVDPGMLPDDFLGITGVSRSGKARDKCVLVTVKLFTDGAQVYANSTTSSCWPILASVHSITPFDKSTGQPDETRREYRRGC